MLIARRVLLSGLVLSSLTACSRLHARAPAQLTALEMPPPPARVTIPVTLSEPEEPPAPPPPPATPAVAPARPRDTSPARSAERAPATPPAVTPPAVEAPAPVLQTTADVGAIEQRTTSLIASAKRDLERVGTHYGEMGANAKAQYDTARSLVRRAEDALRNKNYTYAYPLADKAATMAGLLGK